MTLACFVDGARADRVTFETYRAGWKYLCVHDAAGRVLSKTLVPEWFYTGTIKTSGRTFEIRKVTT